MASRLLRIRAAADIKGPVKGGKRSVWLREQLMFGRCSRRNRSSQDHGDSLNRITNLIHTRQNIQRCRQLRSWESSPDQRCRASCLKGIQIKGTEDDKDSQADTEMHSPIETTIVLQDASCFGCFLYHDEDLAPGAAQLFADREMETQPVVERGDMPLVRIDLVEGKSDEYREKVGELVYQTLVDILSVPKNDRFLVITEHRKSVLSFDRDYLGVHRLDDCISCRSH
jgi:hypothetical protein